MKSINEQTHNDRARIAVALERIATAIEAHLELAKKAADPEHITADTIRSANRANLLLIADSLGITKWAESEQIVLANESNQWLRGWCLKACAGEDLPPLA